jgi:hypothetical protein
MIKKSDLNSLPGKKVYFAHQSVGYNIIEGMKKIIAKNNELNFIKILTLEEYLQAKITEDDSSFYLIHSGIGRNMFPDSKISDFRNKLDTIGQVDAAFLKFCFIDVNRSTDVNLLHRNYMDAMSQFRLKYGNTKFLYFTCPVTAKENFIRGVIKAILNRPDDLNKNRNRFNNLIRENENIELFDLAFYESHEDNEKTTSEREYLLKKYSTSDGGHLNDPGSEKIGAKLLLRLNDIFE